MGVVANRCDSKVCGTMVVMNGCGSKMGEWVMNGCGSKMGIVPLGPGNQWRT